MFKNLPLAQIDSNTWLSIDSSAGEGQWRLFRTPEGFLVAQSPGLCEAPSSLQLLQALWFALAGDIERNERIVFEENALHLHMTWPIDSLPLADTSWANLVAHADKVREALARIEQEELTEEPEALESPSDNDLSLMQDVLGLLEQDPLSAELSELDESSAVIMLAPENDDDWVVFMRPSNNPDWVNVLYPLSLLPSETEPRDEALKQALQNHSSLRLGPHLQVVADPGGQQLMLQGSFDVRSGNVNNLRVLIGHMMAVAEEFENNVVSASGSSISSDEDAMALYMNGLRV